MKTGILYTLAAGLGIILFTACKKDKKEEKATVTGYYQGYIQAATGGSVLNIGILHRNNSTSRLYQFPTGVADTAQVSANAVEGVWSLTGNAYHCVFSKDNNTVTFDATVTAPGNKIEGNFQQSGVSINGTFVLNKK